MLGAIIGDIVGSAYEFNPTNDYNFEMFAEGSKFTDDTICTIAIADALLKGCDYGESLHKWCRRYMKPKGGFGGRFRKWVESDNPQPYGSYGNGSAMRVSPIGMWFSNDYEKLIEEARKSAECTHNHPEGIKGAVTVAEAIAWAVKECDGLFSDKKLCEMTISAMVDLMSDNDYNVNTDYEEFRGNFDETCQKTVPPALDIICKSNSFEDAIRTAVSLAVDADTIGAIVGSIAEHIWGIPSSIKEKAMTYLTDEMREVVDEFYLAMENRPDYKLETKQKKKMESLMFWSLGAGDVNKFLSNENPMPAKDKKATASSWEIKSLPLDNVDDINMHFEIPEDMMKVLMQGHIPEVQEDHWFMYCDESHIRYYRSWSGDCAFDAHFHKEGDKYVIDHLYVNLILNKFGVNGDIPAKVLFLYLVCSDMYGVNHRFWLEYIHAWEEQLKINIDKAEEESKESEASKRKAEQEAEEKKRKQEEESRKRQIERENRKRMKELNRMKITERAIPYMKCVVAGTHHIKDQNVYYKFEVNDMLTLKCEDNIYDENAVALYFKDDKVGYVPRRQNAEISKILRAGWENVFVAYVSDWQGCGEKRKITVEIMTKMCSEQKPFDYDRPAEWWARIDENPHIDPFSFSRSTFLAYSKAEVSQLCLSTRCCDGKFSERMTPERIDSLKPKEIFVFGSNAMGYHNGGAACAAMKKFGAVYGQGDGLQGQSYAISTMEGLVNTARNINRFIDFAANNQDLKFFVTPIGCGIAGFTPLQIAPLFRRALVLPNVYLPKVFWEYFWIVDDIKPEPFRPSKVWKN